MRRSTNAWGLVALLATACAQTSQPPGTTAPLASVGAAPAASSAAEPAVQAPTSPAPSSVPAAAAPADTASAREGASGGDGGVSAQLRACRADADCVAVPRAGCCHNGWKEAVAVSQADAYRNGNPCTKSPRPICPMYMVRDPRVPRCDSQTHLCTLVRP
jgi:hypothetical protein